MMDTKSEFCIFNNSFNRLAWYSFKRRRGERGGGRKRKPVKNDGTFLLFPNI